MPAWHNIQPANQFLLTLDIRYTYEIRKPGSPQILAGTSLPSIVRETSDLLFKTDIARPSILPRRKSDVNHREFEARGGQAVAAATTPQIADVLRPDSRD